jgi:hypothetical protein
MSWGYSSIASDLDLMLVATEFAAKTRVSVLRLCARDFLSSLNNVNIYTIKTTS